MHDGGQQRLGPAVGVKGRGARLGDGPQDPDNGQQEQRQTQRLVPLEQQRLARQRLAGVVGQAAGHDAQRNQGQDQQSRGPVQGAGDRAVGGGRVGEGHGVSFRAQMLRAHWRRGGGDGSAVCAGGSCADRCRSL